MRKGKKISKPIPSETIIEDSEHESDAENPVLNETVISSTTSTHEILDIQPKKLLPYLRKFDPNVFKLLSFPLVLTSEVTDFSEIISNLVHATQAKMEEVERLSPETLIFLLTELNQQAENCSTNNQRKNVINTVDSLLESVCSHINTILDGYKV